MNRKRFAVICIFVMLMALTAPAFAWNPAGHMAIARAAFEQLNKAVVAAKLQVPIAAEYSLAAAAEAHKRLAAGHLLGKIVVRVR